MSLAWRATEVVKNGRYDVFSDKEHFIKNPTIRIKMIQAHRVNAQPLHN
jgi:hypothetical protein